VSILLDFIYLLAALLASPWIAYRLIAKGDWRGLSARFGVGLGSPLRQSIWLHGSSAGEVALLVPLVRLLDEGAVSSPIVVSAYSATGIAAARKTFPTRRVVVFPFDLSFVVDRVLKRVDPAVIVIVESEFWPNFLLAAARRGVPVVVVNGKVSARSSRLYSHTRLIPRLLSQLRLLAVQSDEYARRMSELGVPEGRIRVTGNMKFDLVHEPEDSERSRLQRALLGYRPDSIVVIGGSVHENEDAALVDAIRALAAGREDIGLVLVPRYPRDAGRVEQLVAAAGLMAVRKTAIDRGECTPPGTSGVLLVDTVGELRQLYGIADVAYVGGSLFYRGSNRGGHNLMEPAVQGVPVVFGPYHESFKDAAAELIDAGGGFEVRDATELLATLRRLVDDEDLRSSCGQRAAGVIAARQGATEANFELLIDVLARAGIRLPARTVSPTMPPALSDAD
jgi:3-deoxy-D-manno-octulosonic-acid transferase